HFERKATEHAEEQQDRTKCEKSDGSELLRHYKDGQDADCFEYEAGDYESAPPNGPDGQRSGGALRGFGHVASVRAAASLFSKVRGPRTYVVRGVQLEARRRPLPGRVSGRWGRRRRMKTPLDSATPLETLRGM